VQGSTGHSLGAAGGFEAVACVKALEMGLVPPTINYETPDPECDLDYTPNQVSHAGVAPCGVTAATVVLVAVLITRTLSTQAAHMPDLRVAISDNLGFGGHNGVVAFRKLA
jgi:3-oxoacyl-[acyl-carrier-protein] synthase II